MGAQEQFMQDANATAQSTQADLDYAQQTGSSLMARRKTEPTVRVNKITGEVAIKDGDKWNIFPDQKAAAAGILQAAAEHPDLPALQDPVSRMLQSAQGGVRNALQPYIGDIPSSLVSGLIPGSAPELAGDAALALATGGTSKLAGPVKAGLRILAPTLASAGTAMGVGTDPFSAGLSSLAGAAVPEVLNPLAKWAGRFGSSIVTPGRIYKQGEKDATSFLKALTTEAPHLPHMNTTEGLVLMQDPAYGKAALQAAFDSVDDKISKALAGQGKVTIPNVFQKTMGAVDPTLANAKASQRIVQQIDAKDLPDAIKVIKQFARESGDDAMGFNIRQAARLAEEQYKTLLARVNPLLKLEYEDAVANFDKGTKLINLIQKSKAVMPTDKGPILDTEKLAAFLVQNVGKYPPTEFPSVWAVVSRGGPFGSADVTKTILRGERALAGQGIRGSIPLPNIMTRQMAGVPAAIPGTDIPQMLYDVGGIRAANALMGQ